jgi:hypothetical protein
VNAGGIDRRTHYNWLKTDPSYAKEFERAKLMAADAQEEEAWRRVLEGTQREVLYKRKPVMVNGEVYFETTYSDRMLIFLLKSLRPEKYRERSQALADWDGDVTKLTDAQLAKMEQGLVEQARKEAAAALKPASDATIDVKPEKPEPDGGTGK